MNRNIVKLTGVLTLALLLSGCLFKQQQTQPPATVEPVQPPVTVPEQPQQPQAEPGQNVPPPPKMQSLNWPATVSPLVAKMVKADGITAGSVLLVDNVKNSTNGSLQGAKATAALQDALGKGPFTLVTPQQMAVAKQTLGLSAEDSLVSRSKAIGLARYVGAQYVLYSNAKGDIKSPTLQMQLMLVQTGEIIWSGNGDVVH